MGTILTTGMQPLRRMGDGDGDVRPETSDVRLTEERRAEVARARAREDWEARRRWMIARQVEVLVAGFCVGALCGGIGVEIVNLLLLR